MTMYGRRFFFFWSFVSSTTDSSTRAAEAFKSSKRYLQFHGSEQQKIEERYPQTALHARSLEGAGGVGLCWNVAGGEEMTYTPYGNTYIHTYIRTYIHTYIHTLDWFGLDCRFFSGT